MRSHWNLPDEEQFRFTGVDWLQNLLGKCDTYTETRRRILLLLWRAWWLRDDCIHADGNARIGQSASFLVKYAEETKLGGRECMDHEGDAHLICHQGFDPIERRRAEIKNGKKPLEQCNGKDKMNSARDGIQASQSGVAILGTMQTEGSKWEPPNEGWWKLNTDASFLTNTGDTTAGVIVRTHQGVVALACGQRLHACKDSEEAEISAVLHGLSVLSKYYRGPVCVESDCASVITLLKNRVTNQSALFPLVTDVWHVGKVFKEVIFRAIRRPSNKMAHELAALARRQGEFFKLGDVPPSLRSILLEDCNSSSLVS